MIVIKLVFVFEMMVLSYGEGFRATIRNLATQRILDSNAVGRVFSGDLNA